MTRQFFYLALWSLFTIQGATVALGSNDIFGTMSNFDVYNETETEAHGAEIELEGIHIEDISRTFPSNFDTETIVEYVDGSTFGTRISYSGYNLNSSGFLAPTLNPISTNGHTCVGTEGCEHFGFSVRGVQPSAARYYWLDQSDQRIGAMPMSVPTPSWTYIPGNAGGQPRLRAEVEVPEPPEVIEQRPDSIWMKVFKTEIDRPVDLMELMSNNGIVPDGAGEVETEWELLEGGLGKVRQAEADVPDGHYAVIRRYEYFEYTGQYDAEHEPITLFLDKGDLPEDLVEPPADELGQFIASNMVAANLAAPEEGDFDQDDDVDGSDFLAWQRGFQSGNKLEDGDANWDDSIDGDDLQIWQGQFSGVAAAAGGIAGTAVPEPSSALLALIGCLGWSLLGFSRRANDSDFLAKARRKRVLQEF